MPFISAPLLAEAPLISFLSEPENVPPAAHRSQFGTILGDKTAQTTTLDSSNDLMSFADPSNEDKLYTKIYQKNLQKFLASSFCLNLTKIEPAGDKNAGNRADSIPSIIDDQVCMDGPSRESIDELDNKHSSLFLPPEKKNEDSKKHERCPRVDDEAEEDGSPLILSDVLGETDSNSSDGPMLSRRSEKKRAQFTRVDRVNFPSYRADMVADVEDLVPTTLKFLPSEHDYSSDTTPSDSDPLSDAVPRDSDYLAGESSSSREDGRGLRGNLNTYSNTALRSCPTPAPRRIVKINLPHAVLNNMQEDPRFDGFCHAWLRRPDLCRHGLNCRYIHDYPMPLVKRFGMVAIYIGPDGNEIKSAEKFLELDEAFANPKRTKPDQGTKESSLGCYNGICQDFTDDYCTFGERCWYKHPKTVVENGKTITKDIRQLVDGEFRLYEDLNEYEKVEFYNGFWGDYQSDIPPKESARSRKYSRVSYSESNNSQSIPHKSHRSQKLAKGTSELPLQSFFDSEEDKGTDDVDSDIVEQCYNPGPSNTPQAVSVKTRRIHTNYLDSELPTSVKDSFKAMLVDVEPTIQKFAVAQSKNTTTSTSYNYWEDEVPVDDKTDYWKNAPSVKVSSLASRQNAITSEAMTYAGLFREEPYIPRKAARTFVMPPQPLEVHRDTKALERRRAKQAFAQVMQEKKRAKESLINISTFQGSKPSVKESDTPSSRYESVFDIRPTRSAGGDESSGSGSGWTKSLKDMLVEKCEPIKCRNFEHEPKANNLIDI